MRYKVTMICREIWRAEVVVEHDSNDLEAIKDKAWAGFDVVKSGNLEQENFTKVQTIDPPQNQDLGKMIDIHSSPKPQENR